MSVEPDPGRLYSSANLTKGTLSVDEVQALLRHWRPGETPSDFAERVRQTGIVTKRTTQRANDVVSLFRSWFLLPDDRAARRLKLFSENGGDRRTLSELIFLHKARREYVLADFTRRRFWLACHEGALYLRTSEVEEFLQDAQESQMTGQLWKPETQERLAQGITRALLDVGFLQRGPRNTREYVLYRVTDFSIAYLAYDLHLGAQTDAGLAMHPDWELFGLSREQVLDRLDALDERAGLLVQRAGSVIRITWGHHDMEGVIHAFTTG